MHHLVRPRNAAIFVTCAAATLACGGNDTTYAAPRPIGHAATAGAPGAGGAHAVEGGAGNYGASGATNGGGSGGLSGSGGTRGDGSDSGGRGGADGSGSGTTGGVRDGGDGTGGDGSGSGTTGGVADGGGGTGGDGQGAGGGRADTCPAANAPAVVSLGKDFAACATSSCCTEVSACVDDNACAATLASIYQPATGKAYASMLFAAATTCLAAHCDAAFAETISATQGTCGVNLSNATDRAACDACVLGDAPLCDAGKACVQDIECFMYISCSSDCNDVASCQLACDTYYPGGTRQIDDFVAGARAACPTPCDEANTACGLNYPSAGCRTCVTGNADVCGASTACGDDPQCLMYVSCVNGNGGFDPNGVCASTYPVGAGEYGALWGLIAMYCESECEAMRGTGGAGASGAGGAAAGGAGGLLATGGASGRHPSTERTSGESGATSTLMACIE